MKPLENFLLRAYLQGDLDEAEESAFELLVLERPDLAALVEADTALSIGLAESALASPVKLPDGVMVKVDQRQQEDQSDRVVPIHSATRRPRFDRLLSLAAAASVALAVGLGAGLQFSGSGSQMRPARLAYVDKLRATATPTEILIPSAETLVLMVPVASVEPCLATVVLRQGEAVNLRAQSMPDQHSHISLVLDPKLVESGQAQILVSCADRVLGEYDLQFVSQ